MKNYYSRPGKGSLDRLKSLTRPGSTVTRLGWSTSACQGFGEGKGNEGEGRRKRQRGRVVSFVCSSLAGFTIWRLFGVCVCMCVCEFHPIYNLKSY